MIVSVSAPDQLIFEDTPTPLSLFVAPQSPTSTTVITITGIPASFTVTGPGTFDPDTGIWEVTTTDGTPFVGGPTLTPPQNADFDLPNLLFTVVETDTVTGAVTTTTETFDVIVDAVADAPNALNTANGDEDTTVALDINTALIDTDGSETVDSAIISNLPVGFTLSAGIVDPMTGDVTLTAAELAGLTISAPPNFNGTISLDVEIVTSESNPTDSEPIVSNNTLTNTVQFDVTFDAVNDAPVAADDTFTTDEETIVTGNLLADNGSGPDQDIENDPLSINSVSVGGVDVPVGVETTLTSGAKLTVQANGDFTYDPNKAFDSLGDSQSDLETITYEVTDGSFTDTIIAPGTFNAAEELSSLDGTNGFVINGISTSDQSGRSVSSAGDVNGDGIDDIIIGAIRGDPGGNTDAGESYVVFGSNSGFSASFDLSTLDGTNGFVINGIDVNDFSGFSVSSAGDVNGDGIGDIVIGAERADPGANTDAGESYVVFGSNAGFNASLNLSSLNGTNGFVINGIDASDYSGRSVSSAGDVNGDGIDDLIIGASRGDPGSNNEAGESYVVFGSDTGFNASFDLSSLDGTNGFVINGIDANDFSGRAVSSAGDVNGDGVDDILISAPSASPGGNLTSGESYVVFGSDTGFSASFDLSSLDGTNGFVINGIDLGDASGYSVSSAGDVNGDGIDDIIIGGRDADPAGNTNAGESYVVFGSDTGLSASINLSSLNGTNGFVINGIDAGDQSGSSVSSAGDVNGDGIDDLIIGAPGGNGFAGESFVVFGSATGFGASFDLSSLDGTNGFLINAIDPFDVNGLSVSAAGDINGDGIDDLIIGAPSADPDGNSSAGESYVIFGRANFAPLVDTGTATITINGLPEAVAADDAFTTDEETIVTGNLFADNGNGVDADPDGDALSINSVSVGGVDVPVGIETTLASGAKLTVQANGDFTYDPNDAFESLDNGQSDLETISYEVTDGSTMQVAGTFNAAEELSALDGTNGFTINGVDAADYSGRTVSSAGDVNGDGIDDVIIGAAFADPNGKMSAGEAYVVFGSNTGFAADFDLSSLASGDGSTGFVINGTDEGDVIGGVVSSIGDINNDGVDDFIIGATGGDALGNTNSGESYVIFGNSSGFNASLELSALDGTNGFVLNGVASFDSSGIRVSSAGDVNGDGIDDLIVGASNADPGGDFSAGESYVVFGSSAGFSASFNLSMLDGTNGFRLDGIDPDDRSGISVSSAGDINNDGIDDLIIGASNADPGGDGLAGESYVVFGSNSGFNGSIDLASLDGTDGFRLDGIDPDDRSGISVASAGDINGDGIDDIIIGASQLGPGNVNPGESYVVFGSGTAFDAAFDLASLDGTNGFVINGIDGGDLSGVSVASAGDVNGDGTDDIIIGAIRGDPGGESDAGESYVVFGSDAGFNASFDLSALDGTNGFVLNGVDAGDYSGRTVSSAGDVNGDGIDDLIIGAYRADPGGDSNAGESYVIFGRANFTPVVDTGTATITVNGLPEAVAADDAFTTDEETIVIGNLFADNGNGVDQDPDGDPIQLNSVSVGGVDIPVGVETTLASGAKLTVQANGDFTYDPNGAFESLGDGQSDLETIVYEIEDVPPLDGTNGFVVNGINANDLSGVSVSGAGDVNGDGIDDIIIGANGAKPDGSTATGESYIVFGSDTGFSGSIDLSSLDGTNGFRLPGITLGDNTGFSVSSAGDINGDGIDDVLIGAFGADPGGDLTAGVTYVVFGNDTGFSATFDLSALDGTNGFVLNGIDPNDQSGRSVSSAGDVNGDGIEDIIIGAREAEPGSDFSVGESYVVFGSDTGFSASLDLSSLNGTNGFVINGVDALDRSGVSVSSAGDVNGDGIDDLIIGANNADPGGNDYAGESYVVFGSDTGFSASFDLSTLDGTNGFRMDGIAEGDFAGMAVSSAGDINGDGIDDILVGAFAADPGGLISAGETYVVFGNNTGFSASLDLSTLDGSNGFAINGINPGDFSGYAISAAGDVNGDGIDDILIAAQFADPNGENGAGQTYVVFGSNTGFSASFDLSTLDGTNGFQIDGVDAGDRFGRSVASAGDVNGDGIDDLVIGAQGADPNGNGAAGETYVIFGRTDFTPDLDTGTATITINGVNDAPVAQDDAFTTDEDTIVTGNLITNTNPNGADSDADNDPLSINSVSVGGVDIPIGVETTLASGAKLTVQANGDFTYDPRGAFDSLANGQSDLETITYEVTDGGMMQVAGTFNAAEELSALDGTNGFVVNGTNSGDYSGRSVSSAGDINGDGIDDLFVGAPGGDNFAGESYVVFGSNAGFGASFDLSSVNGVNGFRLEGIDNDDISGDSVAAAGDVNGDGIDDLIVGAYGADPNGNNEAGESYIVFGTDSGFSASFDLSTLNGTNGFVVSGIDAEDYSGISVSSAGDINGDGIDDVIIGASRADPDGNDAAGESYVIFGSNAGFGAAFNVSTLDGTNGFQIDGLDANDRSGTSVASAGDINSDGIDDLIIGAYGANPDGNLGAGESYVIFGSDAGFNASFDLTSLNGTNGFGINGIDAFDRSGESVAPAGDINGDGINDLIIGARRADPGGEDGAGESYVIFGSDAGFGSAFDLSSLNGTNGFRIDGIDMNDDSGRSIASAGDVNGDGIDDLIIGAPDSDPGGNSYSGESYVLFGSMTGFNASFDLSSLNGTNGFRIDGVDAGDRSGFSVASAGDINGDGIDDLIVGAPSADPDGNSSAGESYVIFGRANFAPLVDTGTATITINGVNDAPVVDSNGIPVGIDNTVTFTEGTDQGVAANSGALIAPAGTLFDADTGDTVDTLTITLTNNQGDSGETLFVDPTVFAGGVTVLGNGTDQIVLSRNGALQTQLEAAFQAVRLQNNSDTPNTTDRIIEVVANDGDTDSATSTITVSVVASDDAGIANDDVFNIGDDISALGGSPNVFANNGNGIDSDVDNPLAVTAVNGIAGNVGTEFKLPSGALLTLNADGTFSYDPNGALERLPVGVAGTDTFTYQLTNSTTATVTINLLGLDNDDIFIGTSAIDTFDGGAGFNRISYENSGAVTVDFSNPANSTGDAAGDQLTNFQGIIGSAFDDTLIGGANNDSLEGGAGADTINGGDGIDTASYELASSAVTVDLISGTGSVGDAAGDTLTSIENLRGSMFDDNLRGSAGNNTIFGGHGDDFINASNGDDMVFGEAGDDDLVGGAGADVLDGGAGSDTATYSNSDAAVEVNLGTDTATGGHAAGDTFNDIENLFGSVFGDTLTGDDGSNTINGFNGNDLIDGGLGDDILQGGNGNDTFISSTGADVFSGGTGTDTADYSGSDAGVTVQINNGGTVTGGHATGDTVIVENIIGSDFADDIIGDTLANVLEGNDGDDVFNASSGNDTILGGAGDDFILGSRGGDTINGGTNTGVGDTASYSNSDARVVVDLVAGTATGSGHGSGDTLIDIENIFGSLFNDDIFGDDGANVLEGFNGVDELFGRGGNDTLLGGGGFDFLNGGEGDDILTGGGSDDRFLFDIANFGADIITDFTNNRDLLDMRGSGLQFSDLTVTTGATDTVITVTASPTNSITLQGVTSLINEADFIFDPIGSLEVPGNDIQTLNPFDNGGYIAGSETIGTLGLSDKGGFIATDDLMDMIELADLGGYATDETSAESINLFDQGGYIADPDESDFGVG